MASTTSAIRSTTKLFPATNTSAAPFPGRIGPRTPLRGRSTQEWPSRLSLRRVVGTTCSSPTGFDSVASSFAYIAGGAVVVVDVVGHVYDSLSSSHVSESPATPSEHPPAATGALRNATAAAAASSATTLQHRPEEQADREDERHVAACAAGSDTSTAGTSTADTSIADTSATDASILVTSPTTDTCSVNQPYASSGQTYTQRFFRARPTAVPTYVVPPVQGNSAGILSSPATPKANDSRGRAPHSNMRDLLSFGLARHGTFPTGKTWTSRERIKAATCLSLSRDGRFLAVGETGYTPRVLIFGLEDGSSSDTPLVCISEHAFGVKAVAWSADTHYLASLGAANDGFIYVWAVDSRTGAARLFQHNRCTSNVRGMVWMGHTLITLGVRHLKAWKVGDGASSPTRLRSYAESETQRPLPGRNILLGSLLEATFTCAAVVDDNRIIVCTEAGDVCLLDTSSQKQMQLVHVIGLDFPISSITLRQDTAFVGGKSGQFATLDVQALLDASPDKALLTKTEAYTGVVALAFLAHNLVTVDSSRSVDIWDAAYRPGQPRDEITCMPIPGHREPVLGVQSLNSANVLDAAFVTWAGSGKVTAWGLDGCIKSQLDVAVEQSALTSDIGLVNQLTCVRMSSDGKLLLAADKLGTLRIVESVSGECLMDTKAHSSDCQSISVFQDHGCSIVATCGRDRTVQLFHRLRNGGGAYEHLQTLEFTSRVVQVIVVDRYRVVACTMDRTVQVFDLVSKNEEPESIAALSSRVIALKATPTSMTLEPNRGTVYVSLMDRTVVQYDLASGKQLLAFKCVDEGGAEAAALESLTIRPSLRHRDRDMLVGVSNTDKSVRLYDARTGDFIDREWGHTEAITGVALANDVEGSSRIVSVGSDGTVMIWGVNLDDALVSTSARRDQSPIRERLAATPVRQPLKRILSKQELSEFQRPPPPPPTSSTSMTPPRRPSPPRMLGSKLSRNNLSAAAATRTPTTPNGHHIQLNFDDTPTRPMAPITGATPPGSPQSIRRSSATTLTTPRPKAIRQKSSSSNLRGASSEGNSMGVALEHTCRTLRALRTKILASSDPISAEAIEELDQELRLLAAAVGDRWRGARNKHALNEEVLTGLLDMYSERLLSMLDQRLSLGIQAAGQNQAGSDDTDKESSDMDRDLDSAPESVGSAGDRRRCGCGEEVGRISLPSPSLSS